MSDKPLIKMESYMDVSIHPDSNPYAMRQMMNDHEYCLPDGRKVKVRSNKSFVAGVQVIIYRDGRTEAV